MSGRHRRVSSRSARGRHRKPPQRARVVVPVVGAVAVLGIGGVSAAAALSGGGDHPAARPATRPAATSAPADSPGPVASATPSAPSAAASPARTSRSAAAPDFAVTVVGRVSWVEVDGPHGRVLYLGMLRHGRTLSFPQRPLQVTLGDAGSVRLVLHHHVLARAGKPGEVRHFTVR